MSMFTKKIIKEAEMLNEALESLNEVTHIPKSKEEWVWVEGYKGTDKNMRCNDYQYEMSKQFDIPDDQEVEECKNGFHLCLNLRHVFQYYQIGDGNRFFKVKALVKKSDKERYGKGETVFIEGYSQFTGYHYDKLVAKSIIFISELTIDEILVDTAGANLDEKYKSMAIDIGVWSAIRVYQTDTLVNDGYTEPFAHHIVYTNKFDIAHAVGSQKDLSMDMKVLAILYNK